MKFYLVAAIVAATLLFTACAGEEAKVEETEETMALIADAVTSYATKNFEENLEGAPEVDSMDELAEIVNLNDVEGYKATDAWGNPIKYKRGDSSLPFDFELISLGSDGEEGGEGHAADIVYPTNFPTVEKSDSAGE